VEKVLQETGSPHQVKVYKGVGHVFDDHEGGIRLDAALNALALAEGFLQQHLKRS
jgi:hypothetical protein